CGVCNKGMTVLSRFDGGTHHPNLVQQQVDFPGRNFRILSTWPAGKLDIPDNIPDNVESFYQQALENLHTSRWDAAGAMFRKSLDVATKALSP
ncbi:hypothetical protein, partial [Enterococcus faecalis]|uniref:hypothetical protein n=1 Tax=Enterococcus faecalis TaxID=1351 RepID=UPI00403FBE1A